MTASARPGGRLASRPLHLFWVVDGSGSMGHDGKIQALNVAVREALGPLRQIAADNPTADVMIRAVRFATGATWHVLEPTPLQLFRWPDVTAEGRTDLGLALRLVADAVRVPPLPDNTLPPVIVVVSDGMPTDDYRAGLDELLSTRWGKNAVRIAIAIGRDASYEVLEEFIGGENPHVLRANSPDALVSQLRWASVMAIESVIAPRSMLASSPSGPPATPWAGQQPPLVADNLDVW